MKRLVKRLGVIRVGINDSQSNPRVQVHVHTQTHKHGYNITPSGLQTGEGSSAIAFDTSHGDHLQPCSCMQGTTGAPASTQSTVDKE